MTAASPAATARQLFSPRTMMWVVLVGVISFSAFAALSAYAPDLRSGSDGGGHALSRSAIGFAGLAELLRAEGATVEISRADPRAGASHPGVLVLTPSGQTTADDIKRIAFKSGPILMVLPKWQVSAQPLHDGWVDMRGLAPEASLIGLMKGGGAPPTILRRVGRSEPTLTSATGQTWFSGDGPLGPIDSLQTVSGADWSPMLTDERGQPVLVMSKTSNLFVLSDPDILNNHGLADVKSARTASEIVTILSRGGPVILDVTLHGFKRGRNLLRLALEPPLLGATLCLIAAAVLMGLHAAIRFGPPTRRAPTLALGARALADNSAALVRMAKREHLMAAGYAAMIRESVARAVGAPRDLAAEQLMVLLDRLGVARGATSAISVLTAEANAARTDADLMASAARLNQWRGEMTRDRR